MKGTMPRVLLVGLLLFGWHRLSAAEDVGAVMATLRDEASECRYLCRLWEDHQRAFAAMRASRDAGGVNAAGDAANDTERALARYLEAGRVMLAKHDKRPKCMPTGCVGRR